MKHKFFADTNETDAVRVRRITDQALEAFLWISGTVETLRALGALEGPDLLTVEGMKAYSTYVKTDKQPHPLAILFVMHVEGMDPMIFNDLMQWKTNPDAYRAAALKQKAEEANHG